MSKKRAVMHRLAAATIVLALVGTVPASAHPLLVSSEPQQGARVVDPPEVVVLEFSEPVTVVEITVISPEGDDVARGSTSQEDRNVRQPLGAPPEKGSYTVRYQVISRDDHTITGEMTFDYAGPVTELEAGGPDEDGHGEATAAADPNLDASADERPLILRLWPLLLLALVSAAGITVAARAFRSTHTPRNGG